MALEEWLFKQQDEYDYQLLEVRTCYKPAALWSDLQVVVRGHVSSGL